MYDRPTLEEIIDAARMHMETNIAPAVRNDHKLYFQTLVAINVLRIAGRELELGFKHAQAEWLRLNQLEGIETAPPNHLADLKTALNQRDITLCKAIRAGVYDSQKWRALFDHVTASTIEGLEVANPRFLATIMQEIANPELDAWHHRDETI